MPRELCTGNGNLLFNMDRYLNIRDIYYPYVGLENHVGGHLCRFGVWSDGEFSWIDDSWGRSLRYAQDSLATNVLLKKPEWGLRIRVEDVVHPLHNLLLRRITVENESESEKEVRFFFSHDLHIYDTDRGITAYYDPVSDTVVHFKGNRYFMIGGSSPEGGIYEYAVGVTEFAGRLGTWKDAEDGKLSGNAVAHGSVDSTVTLRTKVKPKKKAILHYWIAAGKTLGEVTDLVHMVRGEGPDTLHTRGEEYYRSWARKSEINFGDLPAEIVAMFKRSLLVLRTHVDNRGGIIASGDSDILRFNKDTYSYVWPRDGAFVSMGLDAAGYPRITQRFFAFCARAISSEGFLYQKYNADGSWGSTWHPLKGPDGDLQLPIQEDETGMVLYSLWNHYEHFRDLEFIASLYEPLILRAADFMVGYRDEETGLPLPSYDLWEEIRGVSTFTTSAVFGGLKAASRFAKLFGDRDRSVLYEGAAEEVRDAMISNLYDEKLERFIKILVSRGKSLVPDTRLDSSAYGVFEFGVLSARDPMVEATMRQIEAGLWVKTEIGGMARYERDMYQRVGKEFDRVPGNPWPICTLWLANYHVSRARGTEDKERARELLLWVVDRAMESGILAEQIHPYEGYALSVSPLTWSHSSFVLSVVKYLNMLSTTEVCKVCGLPRYAPKRRGIW